MSIAEKPSCKEPSDESLPIGWMLSSFGEAATINPSRTKPESNESDVSFLAMGDISEDGRVVTRQVRPYGEVAKGFTSFINNDVLVAKITPCFENGKGALVTNLLEGVGFGSTEFHVIRAKSDIALSAFLYWHTRSDEFRRLGERNMVGSAGQKRVPTDFIREYPLALPPLPEQQKISAILTTVDDKLDVIARQIEATQTLKQGLMQTLFSRGVGTQDTDGRWVPHAEFKDSELGEIPARWECLKLADVLSQKPEYGANASAIPFDTDNQIRYLRITDIDEYGGLRKDSIKAISISEAENFMLEDGDLLIARSGNTVGKSILYTKSMGPCAFAGYLLRFRFNIKASVNFVAAYLTSNAYWTWVNSSVKVGAQPNINAQQYQSLLIPVPPIEEQYRIATILSSVQAKIKLLQAREAQYQTLKRGLMQKLLTGEWRVRVEASASET